MARSSSSKRPSRLLNLNHSPQSNKDISANNAHRSPLLSLPPEIRSRIWEFVFAVGTIHIILPVYSTAGHHWLTICQFPEKYEKLQPPVLAYHDIEPPISLQQACKMDHYACTHLPATPKSLQQDLPLDFLRTCRLIYHEAVLKPFSSNTFQALATPDYEESTLQNLFKLMVPAQIRAIKRLHLDSIDFRFPRRSLMVQLQGLEQLTVRMLLDSTPTLDNLDTFSCQHRVAVLNKITLKTLKISIEVCSKHARSTSPSSEELVNWLKDLEGGLLDRPVKSRMVTRQQTKEAASDEA